MMSSHDAQENRQPSQSNMPGLAEHHNSRQNDSSSEFTSDAGVTNQRYERGLEVYVSEFQIPREEVASWLADRVGERFAEEAILSGAGVWVDDELSLRDRSLVVVAALITQGVPSNNYVPIPAGQSTMAVRARSLRHSEHSWASMLVTRVPRTG